MHVSDEQIREALKDAEAKGKLSIVVAVSGMTEESLRKIIEGEEISIMDKMRLKALL